MRILRNTLVGLSMFLAIALLVVLTSAPKIQTGLSATERDVCATLQNLPDFLRNNPQCLEALGSH